MTSLPIGWRVVRLDEVCDLINGDRGKNYPSKDALVESGVPFINAGHLTDLGEIDLDSMNYISEERFALLGSGKVQTNDILYCLRGSLGKAAIVNVINRGAVASSLVIIRARGATLPKFVYSFLVGPRGKELIKQFDNGSAQPNLAARSLGQYEIPFPPLDEQRRIVAKLEALQSRSRRAREALDAVPPLLEKLRQSILAAAFRGDLTKDWRAKNPNTEPASTLLARVRAERRKKWEESELAKLNAKGKPPTDDRWKAKYREPEPIDTTGLPELPNGWCWATFAQLTSCITDGEHQSPKKTSQGIPLLSAKHVKERGVIVEDHQFVDLDDAQRFWQRCRPQRGDILICSRGTIGRSAVVETDQPFCLMGSVILARPLLAMTAYLHLAILSPGGIGRILSMAGGTTLSALYLADLEHLPLPVAPLQEQHELLTRLKTVAVDPSSEIRAAMDRLIELDRAILAKAFRGELVPQDPSDQPADAKLAGLNANANGTDARAAGTKHAKKRSGGATGGARAEEA